MACPFAQNLFFLLPLLAPFLLLSAAASGGGGGGSRNLSFSFDRFPATHDDISLFSLSGDAAISGAALALTSPAAASAGRLIYKAPIRFTGRNPGFSVDFSFAISPGSAASLDFSMTPLNGTAPALSVRFNATTDASSGGALEENLVAVGLGAQISILDGDVSGLGVVLNGGERVQAWADYDGESKRIQVRLSKHNASKPQDPFISYAIDLSNLLWREPLVLSIGSIARSSATFLFSWSFQTIHGDPYLMHSEPLDPQSIIGEPSIKRGIVGFKKNYSWRIIMALAFGALFGSLLAFLLMFVWYTVVFRRALAPVECPVHPEEFNVILVEGKDKDAGEKK